VSRLRNPVKFLGQKGARHITAIHVLVVVVAAAAVVVVVVVVVAAAADKSLFYVTLYMQQRL